MICVLAETSAAAFDVSQMPFGAFCTLLLQRADALEVAAFDRFPASLSQETVIRRDCRTIDAQIDADDLIGWRNIGRGNAYDDVQPPFAILRNQVGGIRGITHILRC